MTAQGVQTPGSFWRRIKPSLGNNRQARPSTVKAVAESHRTFQDGQRGVCYDDLFGAYLSGAGRIVVTDPFIQEFYQMRNMMELLETIYRYKAEGQTVIVHLITRQSNPEFADKQAGFLGQLEKAAPAVGIRFSWEFDPFIHDRSITTDHGWNIMLGRGLDIFERFNRHNAFEFQNRLQVCRMVKGFSVAYIDIRSAR